LAGLAGGARRGALPPAGFAGSFPALAVLGLLLVVFQNPIQRWIAARHDRTGGLPELGAWWVWPGVLLTGVYGGYFGAAQGVLLMAVMGIGVPETLQRLNGLKNVLAALVNGAAAVLFAFAADVDWTVAGVIAVGAIAGGQLGSTIGRRLPDPVLRTVIVVVGVVALAVFLRR
jgi:uncharacterized membrane protein YfcA